MIYGAFISRHEATIPAVYSDYAKWILRLSSIILVETRYLKLADTSQSIYRGTYLAFESLDFIDPQIWPKTFYPIQSNCVKSECTYNVVIKHLCENNLLHLKGLSHEK